ncbi:hypothetical protein EG328_010318 [Venturia inaequalis]|uniref:Uncharacterized protein n=1 Tax=Venturia inaequalis TaxID=5025 RepID=A0A8H3ZG35_VENIN|nr:hypothetical protein EG328_010318 [Venturia inaequalis]KAE9991977.1 hypothetical protein EG327_010453 [Venturia inaequalis]RDI89088.1 hypothetical protein Vi05172_g456 [Venturia inaequalis]
MKLSTFVPIVLVLASPTFSCSWYKRCWCQLNDQTYQGKEHQNIPWDNSTVTACTDPGEVGYDGVNNFKTCYRFKWKKPKLAGWFAIDNCKWRKECEEAGASTGYCTEKVDQWDIFRRGW